MLEADCGWTVDLKARKIRVNAISPGPIDTPGVKSLGLTEAQLEQFKTDIVGAVPLARMGRADEYASYLYEHGIRPLEEKALGVQLLRKDRATESEFVTISYWESVEARDPEFLIELPSGVQVLEIVTASGRTGGDA